LQCWHFRRAEHFTGKLKSLSRRYFKLRCPKTTRKLARNGRKRNMTEQNEEKFLLEHLKKILPSRIRFLNR
jgi:hypothetical protein